MKNLSFIFMLLITMTFLGCGEEEIYIKQNVTSSVSDITNTTAIFDVEATNLASYSSFIYIGTTKNLSDATKYDAGMVRGLLKNTIYYYQPFVIDEYDDELYGEVCSFSTKNVLEVTSNAFQTGHDYEYVNFYYRLIYKWSVYIYVDDTKNLKSFGIQLNSGNIIRSGVYSSNHIDIITRAGGTLYIDPVTIQYRPFVIDNNDIITYGPQNSIYLH
jgi:hypothetical protein